MEVVTLTPEFGPAPYLSLLPYTKVPVADLTEICDAMARRQRERFEDGERDFGQSFSRKKK